MPARTVRGTRCRWGITAGVAAVLLLTGCGGPPASPTAPGSPTTRASPAALFADDFDGDDLDSARWEPPTRDDLIYQAEGGLNLVVAPDDTAEGVEATMAPRFSAPFREIVFTMTVPSFGESGPGGPAVTVLQASGRNHEVAFGPSGGALEAVALVCGQPVCAAYDDFVPPSTGVSFEQGEVVPVRVAQTADGIEFFVRNELVGQSAADDASALTGFTIDLYGADGESWHVVIDSLRVME